MNDQLVRVVVVSTPDSSWVEHLYWWSQIILVAIIAVSAFVAWQQLKHLRTTRDDSVRIARATFLLEIDRRWDSSEMIESRRLLSEKRGQAMQSVATKSPLSNDFATRVNRAKVVF